MTRSSALEAEVRRIEDALPFLGALGFAPVIAECSWIVDNLDDVESDLSAFHRVDDYRTLPSARFFSLALRLGAYAGIVQARALAEKHADAPPSQRGASGHPAAPREVDDSVALAELQAAGLLDREVA